VGRERGRGRMLNLHAWACGPQSAASVRFGLRLAAPALALLIAGCSADRTLTRAGNEQANAVPPADARGDILAFMRTYLNDPAGVRDASWSEPVLRPIGGVNRYSSCVRYNPRVGGKNAGSKDSLVLFRGGRLDRFVDSAREQCKDRTFRPFPELERLAR
jgi:hypothetical protein